jgi:integrase/recombinase XerD
MASPRVRRAGRNPLAGIELYNASTDPRRLRRIPTPAELLQIVAAAENSSEVIAGLSGKDRAVYYLLMAHTGFRNTEKASLTPESFELDSDPPAIVCRAASAKNRRERRNVISREFGELLRPWLEGKAPGARVFSVTDKPHLAWHRDLEAAGIPCELDGRYLDLYSLRHFFATSTLRAAGNIEATRRLMGHADIRTTQRYMHTVAADLCDAIQGLPLPAPAAAQ